MKAIKLTDKLLQKLNYVCLIYKMTDIYCGVRDVPKGKKRGSMKECAEKGEVRYFGLNKVDERLLEFLRDPKKKPMSRDKVFIKMSTLKIKLKKMQMEVTDAQKESIKKKTSSSIKKFQTIKELFNKKVDEYNEIVKLFNKLDKEKEAEKKLAAKSAKKTSAKKTCVKGTTAKKTTAKKTTAKKTTAKKTTAKKTTAKKTTTKKTTAKK